MQSGPNRKKHLKKRIANQIANDYLSNISLDGSVANLKHDHKDTYNIFLKLNTIKLDKNERQAEYFKFYKEIQSIENPNRNRLKAFILAEFQNEIRIDEDLSRKAVESLVSCGNVVKNENIQLESAETIGDLVSK
jgi:hypothetical protein